PRLGQRGDGLEVEVVFEQPLVDLRGDLADRARRADVGRERRRLGLHEHDQRPAPLLSRRRHRQAEHSGQRGEQGDAYETGTTHGDTSWGAHSSWRPWPEQPPPSTIGHECYTPRAARCSSTAFESSPTPSSSRSVSSRSSSPRWCWPSSWPSRSESSRRSTADVSPTSWPWRSPSSVKPRPTSGWASCSSSSCPWSWAGCRHPGGERGLT